jgi:uncharacterized protein (TIGR02145 family)
MKKTTFFLMLTLIMMSAASVNAQVTIGSMEDPHGGAVLDLSKATGNSVGLLLPHISLDNVYTWQIGGDKDLGVGMLVYNTNNGVTGGDGIGIYIWEGNAWTRIKTGIENVCPRVVKDSENNTYSTGWFGAAGCWMTQNLRSTKNNIYTDLEENINVENDASLKYYWYPNNDPSILEDHPEYGLLYTWIAATDRTSTDDEGNSSHDQHQGICPRGWHLPSDLEWSGLEKEIATNPSLYSSQTTPYENASSFGYGKTSGYRPSVGNTETTYWGRQMKSKVAVNNRIADGTSNGHGANGFDALLVGDMNGVSAGLYGTGTIIWSSSSHSEIDAWARMLRYDYTGMARFVLHYKYLMFSVRCKKNEN